MSETSAAETFTAVWTDLSCPHCEEAIVGFFVGDGGRGALLLETSEAAVVRRLNEQISEKIRRGEVGEDGIAEEARK